MKDMQRIKARLESAGGKLLRENWRDVGAELRDSLMAFGVFFYEPAVRVQPGMESSRCHSNAYFLHRREGYQLWTGFCLSAGRWVMHSWCFDPKRWEVVDSIGTFPKYYGVKVSQ